MALVGMRREKCLKMLWRAVIGHALNRYNTLKNILLIELLFKWEEVATSGAAAATTADAVVLVVVITLCFSTIYHLLYCCICLVYLLVCCYHDMLSFLFR